jgi:hypothetical protein
MPMVTCGDDTQAIALLAGDRESYSASAVVEYLLSAVGAERLSAKTESEVVLR